MKVSLTCYRLIASADWERSAAERAEEHGWTWASGGRIWRPEHVVKQLRSAISYVDGIRLWKIRLAQRLHALAIVPQRYSFQEGETTPSMRPW